MHQVWCCCCIVAYDFACGAVVAFHELFTYTHTKRFVISNRLNDRIAKTEHKIAKHIQRKWKWSDDVE